MFTCIINKSYFNCVAPTESEKDTQIAKIQQDLTAVQAENTQLKQTIASIQSAAGAVQNTNISTAVVNAENKTTQDTSIAQTE